MEMMCFFGGAAERSEVGPLPWLWGRKWCLKGEVGRESLFLEPTLLLHREEQSFCMPVRASAGEEGCKTGDQTPGPGSECRFGEEIEGEKLRDKEQGRYIQESNVGKEEIKTQKVRDKASNTEKCHNFESIFCNKGIANSGEIDIKAVVL